MIDDTWEDENERSWHATVSDFITEITELEAERDALKGELAQEEKEMEPAIPHRPCQCCKGVGGWMVAEYESGGACVGQHFDECANCKSTGTAPMSRREEVEVELGKVWAYRSPEEVPIHLNQIARTLADEVDERGAVITKLLAMLEPGVSPPKSHTSCDCVECRCHKINEERHARACEIAGRKE